VVLPTPPFWFSSAMIRALLFGGDGTLVDDVFDIAARLNAVFICS
jgi:hypothetical protein